METWNQTQELSSLLSIQNKILIRKITMAPCPWILQCSVQGAEQGPVLADNTKKGKGKIKRLLQVSEEAWLLKQLIYFAIV